MPVVNECGQKWYRLSSWRQCKLFRKLPNGLGFAIGPIMFLKEL